MKGKYQKKEGKHMGNPKNEKNSKKNKKNSKINLAPFFHREVEHLFSQVLGFSTLETPGLATPTG